MLNGTIAPLDAARPIADILDATLGILVSAAKAEFADKNGAMPGSRVALLALGSLGRREFATGSRLRLLFLYDQARLPASLGADPRAWHAQLAQRLMRAVEGLSPEGILFGSVEPYAGSAEQGLAWALSDLKARLDASASAEDLRMLADARVIDAEDGLAEEFEALRQTALSNTAGRGAMLDDARPVPTSDDGDPWDVRHRAGGLDDVELAADAIKLAVGSRVPAVLAATLGATFATAAEEGLVVDEAATQLAEAARLWQNIDGFLSMVCVGRFDASVASAEQRQTLATIGGVGDFDALPTAISAVAERAAAHVAEVVGGTAEGRRAR